MNQTVSEMPPSWLSGIIDECRKIEKLLPLVERRAERDCIVEKIRRHPEGARFVRHENLSETVYAGLGVANHVERDIAAHPEIMRGGPATSMAKFISDELGEPL